MFELSYLQKWKKEVFLEIGVGGGHDFKHYVEKASYGVGMDISLNALHSTKNKCMRQSNHQFDVVLADAQNLPFKENCFSTVLSSETIEHIPNVQRMISEVLRIIKRNGLFAASTPNLNSIQRIEFYQYLKQVMKHPKIYPPETWYSPKILRDILTLHGFKVLRQTSVNYLPLGLFFKIPIIGLIIRFSYGKFSHLLEQIEDRILRKTFLKNFGYTQGIKATKKV